MVMAYDGMDEKAMERRLKARDEHLKSVEKRVKEGRHLYGVALLDDEGKMIGSMMIVDYPTRAELDDWLKGEPYIVNGVWQRIEVKPCNVASIFMKLYE